MFGWRTIWLYTSGEKTKVFWFDAPGLRAGVPMFCGIATSTPRSGEEARSVRAALDLATAFREQPGCSAAYVLTERGGRA